MAKTDRRMRILYVIPSLKTGGAEVLVFNMIQCLRSTGYKVDLCLFNGEETPLLKQLESSIEGRGIYKLGHSFYSINYIWKLIRVIRNYDIVHTHLSYPQLFVAIANIFCGKILITTEHSSNNRKRDSPLLRILDRWMYSRYKTVVCISEVAEKKLRSYLGPGNKKGPMILTINNGVDVERIHGSKPILRESVGCGIDRFVIVMVAGLRPEKDHDTLIRAMVHLPQNKFELWLVGDGVRRDEIEQEILKLHVADRVKLLGLRNDVPSVLKTADVIVMSSHWEGLSLSNIEGMSAGKPFIASDVDGLREVTKDYGILFPHGDDKELARIILELAENQALYEEVSQKCYNRAKEYDLSNMVSEYLKVYENIINN